MIKKMVLLKAGLEWKTWRLPTNTYIFLSLRPPGIQNIASDTYLSCPSSTLELIFMTEHI